MKSNTIIIILFVFGLLCSCNSHSERTLKEKIKNEEFDFTNLEKGYNIRYGIKRDIQYGLIELKNEELIKFWFLTHHTTSDKGGTIYEYPNGKREFYSGFHCCEVQFYENGRPGKKFNDFEEFRAYVKKRNGLRP
jgi:hypothetical protein